jgi:predicted RNA binding protein YcfA (HicA-like mRNA interferase family)
MNSSELLRKPRRGATIETGHGKGGHVRVILNGRKTFIPTHGKTELAPGTYREILKQLGLKPTDLQEAAS